MAGLFLVQIMLGIITVINSLGIIPVGWGVLHQAGAMLLLSAVLYVNFHLYIKSK